MSLVRRFTSLALVVGLAVALAVPVGALAAAKPAPAATRRADQVSDAVRKVMKQNSIPGAIVGVWQQGHEPFVRGFGVRDKKSGKPMTPNLFMRIGSETKTFTGTAVLQLVDAGKVGLEDPISKYVSGVPDGDAITVRELGEMRSGLVSYTANEAWVKLFLGDPYRAWKPRRLLPYGFDEPALFAPGQAFNYSDINAILLGLLVEKVSGESLSAYIADNILRPLHMDETSLPTNASFPRPHADGYTDQTLNGKEANTTNWNPSSAWAAGAMISTLHDLRIWAKSVATGSLLSRPTQRQRDDFLPATGLEPAKYGFALFEVDGWTGHNGSLPGYQSLTMYLPAKHATMVILLNSDIDPPHGELSTLVGKAITRVITPDHVFYFKPGQ
jgi:D-alanyl-D-alanine carboxypeptidase